MTVVRTRFAPSPTGYLHIGGARTALFSWLHARKHGGRFILRIEDTDRERSTPESVNAILEGMTWLGLEYDEGPFFQTQRFERYREVIDRLLAEGKAYKCYCTKERLEALREAQMARKEKPRYDRHCRAGVEPPSPDAPYVVRFKNPTEGEVVVDDLVRGRVVFRNEELDDLIIARSDGTPTYNLTVVVDDLDMGINCIIRGDDHLNNTPRQINIIRALGAEPPCYAHVPMILGADGKRLSKRHGAVSVLQYREEGYLPEALLNYLVRLGWSHGDQEVFTIDEMIELFDIREVNKAASTCGSTSTGSSPRRPSTWPITSATTWASWTSTPLPVRTWWRWCAPSKSGPRPWWRWPRTASSSTLVCAGPWITSAPRRQRGKIGVDEAASAA